jgi:hypothetical protein
MAGGSTITGVGPGGNPTERATGHLTSTHQVEVVPV